MRASWVFMAFAGCNSVWLPNVDDVTFVEGVDHEFMPLPVGATWTYEARTDEGVERIEVEVNDDEKVIQGVSATVVRDTEYLDDEVIEDTWDWFAQDSEGNVWYLGEDTCEYQGGECVDTHGAWEWGVDGALPGIVMLADPAVDGRRYYQEYYPGEAEDVGEVIGTGEAVDVEAGSFTGCVRTHDTSTLDRSLNEEKVFCSGVGLVHVDEGSLDVDLVAYSGL